MFYKEADPLYKENKLANSLFGCAVVFVVFCVIGATVGSA